MATVRDLVRAAVRAAEEKKATDVKAIDVRSLSSVTDYMVIATGSSDTNVRAIAEAVREKLIEKGERPFSVEGVQEGSWVLLDYVDFVVHVFHYEKRLYFGLEELWADARPVPVAGAAPARRTAPRTGGKPAAKPAAAAAEKRSRPPAPRTVLKPTGKKTAVPKRGAAKPAAPAKKAGAPKGTAAARKVAAPKTTAARRASAVPKPKKAVVPKRKAKG